MKEFFNTLPRNIVRSFAGKNILWHVLAIVLTYIIVVSGFDWQYSVATRGIAFNPFLFSALIVGGLLPILLPLIMLAIGAIKKNTRIVTLAWAISQSALIGWFISSFYKAFTGRIPPPLTTTADISREFHFGFLRGGIFWGWPSSHTTVAFAMAFTLIILYPNNKIVKYLSILYALYIGIGVSVSIHWFSEFIAGAMIGAVIGIVVGKSFKNKLSDF